MLTLSLLIKDWSTNGDGLAVGTGDGLADGDITEEGVADTVAEGDGLVVGTVDTLEVGVGEVFLVGEGEGVLVGKDFFESITNIEPLVKLHSNLSILVVESAKSSSHVMSYTVPGLALSGIMNVKQGKFLLIHSKSLLVIIPHHEDEKDEFIWQ